MKKKLLSLLLAATMLIGASLPVSATENSRTISGNAAGKDQTIDMDGKVRTYTIKVEVSQAGNTVIVNPYGLLINSVSNTDASHNSLVIPDISFNNLSDVEVALQLKGQVTVSDNTPVTFKTAVEKEPTVAPAAHTALVYVDVVSVSGNKKIEVTTNGKTAAAPSTVLSKTKADFKNSPILAVSGNEKTNESKGACLKFKGWTAAKANESWPSGAGLKVTITYNIVASINAPSKFTQ